jgi:DNA-binding NarL/FixJ family response regulator
MRLTPRELEIAELVAQGFTNKEVADKLGISWKSVNSQVHVILLVLHIGSRKQVAERLAQLNQSLDSTSTGPSVD